MTYKIAWVQPNFQQGPKELNAFYLPYSAGVLWGYASSDPWIKDNFEVVEWVWRRDAVEPIAKRLSQCDVVAFSTYVWNHNYNYELARQIKQLNPAVLIIFGGPEPAVTDPDIFVKNPFMDLVVCYEGEITFRKILQEFERKQFETIPGLLINQNGVAVSTGAAQRIESLEQLPSPYLLGVFDKLMAEHPDTMWQATLETNRGCPYACTFCDWGSLTYSKVKKFELDRVFEEIEWFGKNNFNFISITDANFGMFAERDGMIADKIIECQERYGAPKMLSLAWAKNQQKQVVDIVKRLLDTRWFNQGLTLSVQTLTEGVLENIHRKNMEMNRLADIFKMCEQRNIPTYTELILGLPGESLQTWKNNFFRLFDMGNHTGIAIFQAQLLENAEMNLLQRKIYKITSQPVTDYFAGSYSNEHVEESIEIITSTKDLSFDEMLDAHIFSWFINTFHINGTSTLLSRFVNRYAGVSYHDFYEELFEFMQTNAWLANEQEQLKKYYYNWMTQGKIDHPEFEIEIHGWNLIHRTVINMHIEKQYDAVFGLLYDFMKRYNLPDKLLDSLVKFQRRYFVTYDAINTYPEELVLDYNIWEYITFGSELTQTSSTYKLDFLEDHDISFSRFLELFYFARRRNYGKATVECRSNQQ